MRKRGPVDGIIDVEKPDIGENRRCQPFHDYMVKPIDVNEMILRVGALLKRAKIATEHRIVCQNTILDYDALTVTVNGQETLLPQKEFYLLYKLLSYPNKIFTRQQLMDEIWGLDSTTDERTVAISSRHSI